ncbi:alpha/beta hydrolase [Deltaproteobacteria bacterium TL4]
MAYHKVNGINLYYETLGQGEPLMMIMGWTANKDYWPKAFLENLSQHYQLILFDNRGSGRSESSPGPYRVKQFAHDTLNLMDSLRIERAHILGISLGGMIAQDLALEAPERVNKLILGCTSSGLLRNVMVSSGLVFGLLKYLVSPEMNYYHLLNYLTFSRDTRDVGVREAIKAGFIAPASGKDQLKQLGAVFNFNSYGHLKNITSPTLVIVGTKDMLISPKHSELLAKNIPNAKLVQLKGMSHAFFVDAPDKFYKEVVSFLE